MWAHRGLGVRASKRFGRSRIERSVCPFSSEALKIFSEPSQGKEFFPAHKSARDGSLSPRKNRPTVGHACTRRPSHLVHPRERPTRYQIAPTHGFARRLEAAHGLRTITTLVRALDAVKSARRCRPGESRPSAAKWIPGRLQQMPGAPTRPRDIHRWTSLSFQESLLAGLQVRAFPSPAAACSVGSSRSLVAGSRAPAGGPWA